MRERKILPLGVNGLMGEGVNHPTLHSSQTQPGATHSSGVRNANALLPQDSCPSIFKMPAMYKPPRVPRIIARRARNQPHSTQSLLEHMSDMLPMSLTLIRSRPSTLLGSGG